MTKSKKHKFFKFKYKIKKGNIVFEKDTFEHMLLCMVSQKHINDKPASGLSIVEYKKVQKEMNDDIENCIEQGRGVLKKFYDF